MRLRRSTRLLLSSAAVALLGGCADLPLWAWNTEVRVEDPAGRPIPGAVVTGGFDWSHYRQISDRSGAVRVPQDQLGKPARILAANHFPLGVRSLDSRAYVLQPTPRRLRPLGDLPGQVLRMSAEEVLTLDRYRGLLHHRIRGDTVVEESAVPLTSASDLSGEVRLFGDELWLSRSDLNAVEVWSVVDPASPRWLYRLEGFRSVLARKDSLLVVAQHHASQSTNHIEIWSLSDQGIARKRSDLRVAAPAAQFVGDALYLLPLGDLLGVRDLKVVSLGDPQHPEIVHRMDLPDHVRVSVAGNMAILTPRSIDPTSGAHHPILDLSDPFRPRAAGHLYGHGYVVEALPDGLALGFTPEPRVESLFHLQDGQLTVAATTAEETAQVWPYPSLTGGAAAPPYFAIAGQLWKLED